MNFNLKSISSKLVIGGISSVLIPLMIVGYMSYSKSESALISLSYRQAEGVAGDLAKLTYNILKGGMIRADSLAAQKRVVEMAKNVSINGIADSQEAIDDVFGDLKKQFSRMGANYQGIYVTDAKGLIYNAVLENGTLYQGIDLSGRDFFLQAKRTGKAVVSNLTLSKI